MIKITLILLILSIISKKILNIMAATLSPKETALAKLSISFPMRIWITGFIFLILVVATIVTGIIAIVRW